MSNFGLSHLSVVRPYDVAFREARSAVGAAHLLANAKEFESVAEAVADCQLVVGTTGARRRELNVPLRDLRQSATLIRKRMGSGRVALLFGSEKAGLSNEDLGHCHWTLRIPTREAHPSMNLGQAVAVCLYEITRASNPPALDAKPEKARAADLERITGLLFDALDVSGYVSGGADAATLEKTRRLVRRLALSEDDAKLWLGMLRQILWKLRS